MSIFNKEINNVVVNVFKILYFKIYSLLIYFEIVAILEYLMKRI